MSLILVVDSVAAGAMYREGLADAGASVTVVESPEAALAACKARPPHLVFADLSARARAVVWLTRVMRSIPELATVPVIAARSRFYIETFRDEFAAVLEHPFGMEELCEAVRAHARRPAE